MADDSRKKAKSLAKAFKKMSKPASKGGTGGTFKTAATKAGYADSTEGRKKFANHVYPTKTTSRRRWLRRPTSTKT